DPPQQHEARKIRDRLIDISGERLGRCLPVLRKLFQPCIVLLPQRLELGLVWSRDRERQVLPNVDSVFAGEDQSAVKSRIARKIERLGSHAQLKSLFDTGKDFEGAGYQLFLLFRTDVGITPGIMVFDLAFLVLEEFAATRDGSRAELAFDGRGQFVGLMADDFVEAVVPKARDLHELWLALTLRLEQFLREIENTLDVIVVDVAHDEQIDVEGLIGGESARFSDRMQSRFKVRAVDTSRPTIDHDQARLLLGSVMQQQAVALASSSDIKAEDHRASVKCFGTL